MKWKKLLLVAAVFVAGYLAYRWWSNRKAKSAGASLSPSLAVANAPSILAAAGTQLDSVLKAFNF